MEHRETGGQAAWWKHPLLVFLLGSLLLSVLSHAFVGWFHLVLITAGATLEVTGVLWGLVRWVVRRRTGPASAPSPVAPGDGEGRA